MIKSPMRTNNSNTRERAATSTSPPESETDFMSTSILCPNDNKKIEPTVSGTLLRATHGWRWVC